MEQFLHKFILCFLRRHRVIAAGATKLFEKGLLRKYALQGVTYEFCVADDASARSYKEACRQALEKHGRGRNGTSLSFKSRNLSISCR